jgi:hypothetical protein
VRDVFNLSTSNKSIALLVTDLFSVLSEKEMK